MRQVIVRYKVRSDQAARNEELIRAVFAELHRSGGTPGLVRYASYTLADGVSFVHVAATEDGVANPLAALPAFREFQRELGERCVEPPVVTELREVGAFSAG